MTYLYSLTGGVLGLALGGFICGVPAGELVHDGYWMALGVLAYHLGSRISK